MTSTNVLALRRYVLLQMGADKQSTSWKKDAGGEDVAFDETYAFKYSAYDKTLKVQVWDKDPGEFVPGIKVLALPVLQYLLY